MLLHKLRLFTAHSKYMRFNITRICKFHISSNDVVLDPDVIDGYARGYFHHPSHPGKLRSNLQLPLQLAAAIKLQSGKYTRLQLKHASKEFLHYLVTRHPPPEFKGTKRKKRIVPGHTPQNVYDAMTDLRRQMIEEIDDKEEAEKPSTWRDIKFDGMECYVYLVGRMDFDYCVVNRLLDEIKLRDPEFKPTNLLDFGTKLGNAVWAINDVWEDSIHEHYCVETSSDMTELALLLLQGGDENDPTLWYDNVYFRKNLPKSKSLYDIVTCAFTLFDLPSRAARVKIIVELWRKTKGYLIFAETGTLQGHDLIFEAREVILDLQKTSNRPEDQGYIFSPCRQDEHCPKQLKQAKRNCSFQLKYAASHMISSRHLKRHRYSYMVFKKGKRPDDEPPWPRVIDKTKSITKQVLIFTCSVDATLQEHTLQRKKHGVDCIKTAAMCSEGDLLPVLNPKQYRKKMESRAANADSRKDETLKKDEKLFPKETIDEHNIV